MPAELLGRHVLRRAGDASASASPPAVRDAEVGDADVAVAVDHHVGRLQIAMEHAALVRRGDAGAELPRELDRLVLRNPSDAAQQRRQILAVDVFHREEAAAVGFAEVVEAADVLVRHLARRAQLVVELREVRRIAGDPFGQELQRDRLIERQIVGAIDFAHAAAAEQRDQPIAAGDDRSRCEAAAPPACRVRPRLIAGRHRRRRPDRGSSSGSASARSSSGATGTARILLEDSE